MKEKVIILTDHQIETAIITLKGGADQGLSVSEAMLDQQGINDPAVRAMSLNAARGMIATLLEIVAKLEEA